MLLLVFSPLTLLFRLQYRKKIRNQGGREGGGVLSMQVLLADKSHINHFSHKLFLSNRQKILPTLSFFALKIQILYGSMYIRVIGSLNQSISVLFSIATYKIWNTWPSWPNAVYGTAKTPTWCKAVSLILQRKQITQLNEKKSEQQELDWRNFTLCTVLAPI